MLIAIFMTGQTGPDALSGIILTKKDINNETYQTEVFVRKTWKELMVASDGFLPQNWKTK